MERFRLLLATLTITAPTTWGDEESDRVYAEAELALDAATEALRQRLLELDPELGVEVDY